MTHHRRSLTAVAGLTLLATLAGCEEVSYFSTRTLGKATLEVGSASYPLVVEIDLGDRQGGIGSSQDLEIRLVPEEGATPPLLSLSAKLFLSGPLRELGSKSALPLDGSLKEAGNSWSISSCSTFSASLAVVAYQEFDPGESYQAEAMLHTLVSATFSMEVQRAPGFNHYKITDGRFSSMLLWTQY